MMADGTPLHGEPERGRAVRDLPAVRTASAVDAAAETLRIAIVDGTIAAGDRLVEASLCESMQISRNTVREVFRLLEAERLVERQRNRGVVVRTLTAADIADIYVVRRLVETGAIREAATLAAERRAQCCADMRAAIDAAEAALEAADVHRLAAADIAFHTAITELAGSARLVELISSIKAELRLAFGSAPDRLIFHRPYVARNRQLCELIEKGEFDAAAAELAQYLDDSRRQLEALIG